MFYLNFYNSFYIKLCLKSPLDILFVSFLFIFERHVLFIGGESRSLKIKCGEKIKTQLKNKSTDPTKYCLMLYVSTSNGRVIILHPELVNVYTTPVKTVNNVLMQQWIYQINRALQTWGKGIRSKSKSLNQL